MKKNNWLKALGMLAVVIGFSLSGFGATFPGSGFGPIPDGGISSTCGSDGTPIDVSFTVSGMSGALSNVEVNMSLTHTWMADVTATLIAPNGTSKVLFGYTGATTALGCGDSSDLAGPYTFKDSALAPPSGGWWQAATAAASTAALPSGDYRSTDIGGAGAVNPQPPTNLTTAFAGVANPNGVWKLRFTDGGSGDTGAVSAATLTLTTLDAANDMTGDGKSDFIIVRADGPVSLADSQGVNDFTGKDKVANMERKALSAPSVTGVGWWMLNNNSSSLGRTPLGVDTDFFQIADFDGDGKDDISVWTPGAQGNFKILRSSTNTVVMIPFGQTGDSPDVIGDWDGDGKDDIAVYRDGTPGSPQSFFFWASLATPTTINYVPWGTDGDVGLAMDYDGDGKLDPVVQRNGGGGAGNFWIRRSGTGQAAFIIYGLSSDFVVPGDYDGDGRDDICVSRNINFGGGTFKYFYILQSNGGGTPAAAIPWGIPGDFITQGDWDGDGKTDLGVWRPNADPNLVYFYARKPDGNALYYKFGQSGDYPVNNWNVH